MIILSSVMCRLSSDFRSLLFNPVNLWNPWKIIRSVAMNSQIREQSLRMVGEADWNQLKSTKSKHSSRQL